MSVYTFPLAWQNTSKGTHGSCRASVFVPEDHDQIGVVMVSPYPGASAGLITPAIAAIADALEKALRLPLLEGYILVEHHPADELVGDRFTMVDLRHDGLKHHSPAWRDIDADRFDALVAGEYKPAKIIASHLALGWAS